MAEQLSKIISSLEARKRRSNSASQDAVKQLGQDVVKELGELLHVLKKTETGKDCALSCNHTLG